MGGGDRNGHPLFCGPALAQSNLALRHWPHRCPRSGKLFQWCHIGFRGSATSSAQTSASLHPPAALRLRVLPFTRGMVAHGLCGRVPDSAGNLFPWIASAQTDANLSAHLHRLPTPPPYLRRMRLSPGQDAGVRCRRLLPFGWGCGCRVLEDAVSSQGRRCWVANDAAGCPWHSSCKSPGTRILVLGTSGAHWPARWPQFVLTEHGSKS